MLAELLVQHHCKLGEGPLWHPDEKALYWTDIEGGVIYRYDPATGNSSVCYEGDKVGGMTLQPDGSFLLFMDRGAVKVWHNGLRETIHEDIPEERSTRFNDVIADVRGRVLCGVISPAHREGRLYSLDINGALTLLLENVGCSNGLAFINNDEQVYFTDSTRGEIYLYDYDADAGGLSNKRIFSKYPFQGAVPDGLTVDSEGFVWTAQWGGGCVIRLNPQGKENGRVIVPEAKLITSVAFGGDDLSTLYITSASVGDPDSKNGGGIFTVRPGVTGVPEYRSNVQVSL
jgi:sugar lactone lactonase YvrE